MRVLAAITLFCFAAVATGCVDRIVTDEDYTAPDFRRPSVEHRVPIGSAVNMPVDEPLTIWFDKLMNEESVRALTFFWREVPANNMRAVAADGNLVYAARSNGGVFRSNDGGRQWLWRSEANPTFNARSLVISNGALVALAGGTVWRSTDEGASFSPSNSGFSGEDGLSLTASPSHPGVLYLTTEATGVYRSTDGGVTWESRSSGLRLGRPILAVAVHPANPDIVAVTTDVDFVYRSENGGQSWARVRDGLTDRHFVDIAFAPGNPDVAYVISVDGTVYRSEDVGTTWAVTAFDPDAAEGFAVAVDPADPDRVSAATNEGLFTSMDGGATWVGRSVVAADGSSVDVEVVRQVLYSEDGTLFVASNAGILRGGTTGNILLEDSVVLDNLRVEGSMTFERWRDTTMVVAPRDYHDPMSADTSFINPYINERALAAWFANGKQGEPPVEAYPEATRVTFTPNMPLASNALYRMRVPGTFEEDLYTYTGARGVEDIHGNSMETSFESGFRTEP